MSGNDKDQERQAIELLLDYIICSWNRFIQVEKYYRGLSESYLRIPPQRTIQETLDYKYEVDNLGESVDKTHKDMYFHKHKLDKLLWKLHDLRLPLNSWVIYKECRFMKVRTDDP